MDNGTESQVGPSKYGSSGDTGDTGDARTLSRFPGFSISRKVRSTDFELWLNYSRYPLYPRITHVYWVKSDFSRDFS